MLSIISPIFNEEQNIPILIREISETLNNSGRPYEMIFIDDGSTDKSFEILREISQKDNRVRVVRFRKNFGQTAALSAGIKMASGDVLIPIDADLQNNPADIPRLLQKLDEGYDVVSGWRKDRKDKKLTRVIPSKIANWLISRISGVRLNDYGCTLKAYRKDVIKNVRLYGEMHRFIPVYAAWEGARVAEIAVDHRPRKFGKSKYGLIRTVKVLLDLITIKFLGSYATKPIYMFGGLGMMLSAAGVFVAGITLFQKFLFGHFVYRNPLVLLAVLLFIVGVQFVMMGILAEISIRIYHESQDRPTYTVSETVNIEKKF